MTDRLRVVTDDGKYTIIQKETGELAFLRYSEPWHLANTALSFEHTGLILALAQNLAAKNTEIERMAIIRRNLLDSEVRLQAEIEKILATLKDIDG